MIDQYAVVTKQVGVDLLEPLLGVAMIGIGEDEIEIAMTACDEFTFAAGDEFDF